MRILLVNPNTTAAMTEKIGRAARAAAAPGTQIIAVNPPDGPVSIEGYYDAAFSVPGLLAEIAKGDAAGVSAHIIACFDDTGLEAARSVAFAPVIGIGEAAFHLASMLGHRFSVVTTLSRSIAAIENNLRFETEKRVEISSFPGLYDFAPVRDRDSRRRRSTLVKVCREEVETLCLEAELRIRDSTFADQNHLLSATHRRNRGGPFFQCGVVREFVHGPGRKVTELTGPSHMVTARTIAFSPATASASSR